MGGHLLQVINRDVQRFAFKSSAQCRNGIWYDIMKNPLDQSKKSKTGKLALIEENGIVKTVRQEELNNRKDILQTVFLNGELVKEITFGQVRTNSNETSLNLVS